MSFTRIAVIYNPASGRPRERTAEVDRFTRLLEEAGCEVAACPTERPHHATDLAREKVAEGYELIVAHGGDGTMNEVLQAVVGTQATLGFWPGGTANVLAAEIRFPSRVDEVVSRILDGNVMQVTVGKANQRYFLLMAGIGLDAAVTGAVDPALKQRVGKAAYGVAAMKVISEWALSPLRIKLADEEIIGRFVVAGNAHSYGGGFKVTPRADLRDPMLDLCIFTSDRRADYLPYAVAALRGQHQEMPGVIYRKVSQAVIENAAERPALVQLDGELAGEVPLVLEAMPEALRLLV